VTVNAAYLVKEEVYAVVKGEPTVILPFPVDIFLIVPIINTMKTG